MESHRAIRVPSEIFSFSSLFSLRNDIKILKFYRNSFLSRVNISFSIPGKSRCVCTLGCESLNALFYYESRLHRAPINILLRARKCVSISLCNGLKVGSIFYCVFWNVDVFSLQQIMLHCRFSFTIHTRHALSKRNISYRLQNASTLRKCSDMHL